MTRARRLLRWARDSCLTLNRWRIMKICRSYGRLSIRRLRPVLRCHATTSVSLKADDSRVGSSGVACCQRTMTSPPTSDFEINDRMMMDIIYQMLEVCKSCVDGMTSLIASPPPLHQSRQMSSLMNFALRCKAVSHTAPPLLAERLPSARALP